MDAIAMLKEDHDKVKGLLAQLESTTERGVKTRQELFATIKGELTVHEIIEEEIFYPELKAHPKARDIVLEGYEEHHVVDLLMGELEGLDVSDETWGAKAIVMKENVEHHIDEEEGEMFSKARQVFDRAELVDLGERMATRKASAKAELKSLRDAATPGKCTWSGAFSYAYAGEIIMWSTFSSSLRKSSTSRTVFGVSVVRNVVFVLTRNPRSFASAIASTALSKMPSRSTN